MNTILKTAILVAVVVAGDTPLAASAVDLAPATASTTAIATVAARHVRYTILNAQGERIGELVGESAHRVQLSIVGHTTTSPLPNLQPVFDRTFHPDFTNALTPAQINGAVQTELARLFPPNPISG